MKNNIAFLLSSLLFLFICFSIFSISVSNAQDGDPLVTSVEVYGVEDGWPAGEMKSISFDYSNFSGDTKNVVIQVCYPGTSVCNSFATKEARNLQGSGSGQVSKAIGPLVHERIIDQDNMIIPYFRGYSTQVRVCPSKNDGTIVNEDGCAYAAGSIEITPNPDTQATISDVTIDDISQGWEAGTRKRIHFSHTNFGDDTGIRRVITYFCHPSNNDNSAYDYSRGSCHTFGPGLGGTYRGTRRSYVKEYFFPSAYDNATYTNRRFFDGYQTLVKVCAADIEGNVDKTIPCAYSEPFSITPHIEINESEVSSAFVNAVAHGWPAGETKSISFDYSNFSGDTKNVMVQVCHPDTNRCNSFAIGEAMNLQRSGSGQVSKTIGPLVYDRITAGDAEITQYFRGYYTNVRVCPATNDGTITNEDGCVIARQVRIIPGEDTIEDPIDEIEPEPVVTYFDISGGRDWPSGESKTIHFYYEDFSDDTKNVVVQLCHPETWEGCNSFSMGDSLNLSGSGDHTVAKSFSSLLYSRIASGQNFSYIKDYMTQVRVCPATNSGTITNEDGCVYRGPYEFKPDDWTDLNSRPSGQGCFEGECVCVDGVVKRCGDPMQPGTGCDISCGLISKSAPQSRWTASLGFVSDQVISWYNAIYEKIF